MVTNIDKDQRGWYHPSVHIFLIVHITSSVMSWFDCSWQLVTSSLKLVMSMMLALLNGDLKKVLIRLVANNTMGNFLI